MLFWTTMMMMMMLSRNRIIPMNKTMNDELTIVFFILLNMSIELLSLSLSLSFTLIFLSCLYLCSHLVKNICLTMIVYLMNIEFKRKYGSNIDQNVCNIRFRMTHSSLYTRSWKKPIRFFVSVKVSEIFRFGLI